MDVSTPSTVTISTMGVHKVPLDAWGPIGGGLSALLIGRSSATIQEIMVHVGVIDADYTGQICAMVSTPTPPLCTEKGTCIAQLIPFMSCVPRTKNIIRGTGGFGSTGVPQVHWTQTVNDHRPEMTCVLSMAHASPTTVNVSGLLDTGADVTVISLKDWPTSWPMVPASQAVVGLGGTSTGCLAAKPVLITNPEDQAATIQPYVTVAPLNLWG
ncbi:endogenous retrovirus group K member 9 Pol protein-like protein [Pitangus sulphuratus]|nr:endogenous retrovirus group K member 9 Pol protein-like protein [Pitangus sulphuratus]